MELKFWSVVHMDVWTNVPSADSRICPWRPAQHIELNFNCNVSSFRQWQSLPTGEGIEMNLSVNRSENIEIFYFALRNCFVFKIDSSLAIRNPRTVLSLARIDLSKIKLLKVRLRKSK